MKKVRFESELIAGHKGVMAVIVPFNPEQVFAAKPVRLDPRRDGWLVKGTANGAAFESYIGNRWGRFFIMLKPEVREAAKASEGQMVTIELEPMASASTLARAREQSKLTTAPKKGRADAIDPDAAAGAKVRAKGSPRAKANASAKRAPRKNLAVKKRAAKASVAKKS